jgi:hypothetical protein
MQVREPKGKINRIHIGGEEQREWKLNFMRFSAEACRQNPEARWDKFGLYAQKPQL